MSTVIPPVLSFFAGLIVGALIAIALIVADSINQHAAEHAARMDGDELRRG